MRSQNAICVFNRSLTSAITLWLLTAGIDNRKISPFSSGHTYKTHNSLYDKSEHASLAVFISLCSYSCGSNRPIFFEVSGVEFWSTCTASSVALAAPATFTSAGETNVVVPVTRWPIAFSSMRTKKNIQALRYGSCCPERVWTGLSARLFIYTAQPQELSSYGTIDVLVINT